MARKTIQELETNLETAKTKMEQSKHRLNREKQRLESVKPNARTNRNKRLIRKGIAFEKSFPNTTILTEEESYELMERLSNNPEASKIVEQMVKQSIWKNVEIQ